MNVTEEYKLSMYQDYGPLGTKEHIRLVRSKKNGQICVKKTLDYTQRDVVEFRKRNQSLFFPELFEVFEQGDSCTIIEEYVNGITLEEYMMGESLVQEEAVRIAHKICRALLELHHASPMIVYRDLKTENVVITREGNVKLVDFNISRSFQEGKKRDTVLLGTAEYAAPEQFGYFQTDNRTDIYAFGILFNYMLTGKFPAEQVAEGKYNHLIKKCIELEPSKRYQRIEEVLVELGEKDDMEQKENGHSQSWIIPGFRSKVVWKMVLASMGYFFMTILCLDMDFVDGEGVEYTGLMQWMHRILMLMSFLATILFSCNYRGISKGITVYQHKSVLIRILSYIVTWFIFIVVAVTFSNLITDILEI